MTISGFLYTATMSPDLFHELQVSASTQQIESCIRYLPSNFRGNAEVKYTIKCHRLLQKRKRKGRGNKQILWLQVCLSHNVLYKCIKGF